MCWHRDISYQLSESIIKTHLHLILWMKSHTSMPYTHSSFWLYDNRTQSSCITHAKTHSSPPRWSLTWSYCASCAREYRWDMLAADSTNIMSNCIPPVCKLSLQQQSALFKCTLSPMYSYHSLSCLNAYSSSVSSTAMRCMSGSIACSLCCPIWWRRLSSLLAPLLLTL